MGRRHGQFSCYVTPSPHEHHIFSIPYHALTSISLPCRYLFRMARDPRFERLPCSHMLMIVSSSVLLQTNVTVWRHVYVIPPPPHNITHHTLHSPEGHSDADKSVTFSADGSTIASASRDNTIRLWDGAKGAHIATLDGNSNWIESIAFSEDGSRLPSVSDLGPVQLWDSKTGTSIPAVPGESPSCSFPTLPLFSLCGPSYSNSLYLTTSSRVSLDALVLTFGVDDSTNHPFFFSPPDITPWHVAQSPTDSLVAIGCDEGHVLFVDVSAMMLS